MSSSFGQDNVCAILHKEEPHSKLCQATSSTGNPVPAKPRDLRFSGPFLETMEPDTMGGWGQVRSRDMPKWNIAVAALWVMVITSVFFLPPARSQQAESQPEVYVGMIVTRSAEDAQAVLNQLKAGMDFGVLAKEKSIDPSSNDGGYRRPVNPGLARCCEGYAQRTIHRDCPGAKRFCHPHSLSGASENPGSGRKTNPVPHQRSSCAPNHQRRRHVKGRFGFRAIFQTG